MLASRCSSVLSDAVRRTVVLPWLCLYTAVVIIVETAMVCLCPLLVTFGRKPKVHWCFVTVTKTAPKHIMSVSAQRPNYTVETTNAKK